MNYISTPNLPQRKVALFIADAQIEDAIVIPPANLDALSGSLRHHADLGICVVSANKAVCPTDSYDYYKEVLSPYGFEITQGKSRLGCHYPKDCAYNICIVGKKCFLNKRVCDSTLFDILTSEGYEIIHVNQGYTKCSVCPIDENSIITADASIAQAARARGMEVLLISNDGIFLEGYNNGFFGGSCGMGAAKVLLVNGEIDTLPQGEIIRDFLNKKGIEIKSLKKGCVTDIGSVLPLLHKI